MRLNRTSAVCACVLAAALFLGGCGRERVLDNLYNASSELFSSSYDMSRLYNYYDPDDFRLDGQRMTYTDSDDYETRLGIDVSEHQGDVDWNKVKKDGYQFAFLRIGYRGYGDAGTLSEDATFEKNYREARRAGLDVGIYFFSQAVTEAEAEEEAEYVLKLLHGRDLDLPVAYDIENIDGESARTDNVSGDQFTANVKAFSLKIADGGYNPCLYTNLMWETFTLDMRELYALPIWFSGYEKAPSTNYNFFFWQYTNKGEVDGIDGDVDLNIQMIPKDGSDS